MTLTAQRRSLEEDDEHILEMFDREQAGNDNDDAGKDIRNQEEDRDIGAWEEESLIDDVGNIDAIEKMRALAKLIEEN